MPVSSWCSTARLLIRRRFWLWLTGLLLVSLGGPRNACQAYTSSSPEVRAVVEKALGFLGESEDRRVGGKALVGLVFVKARQLEHPKVKEAVAACLEFAGRPAEQLAKDLKFYDVAVAIIFLCELDPNAYYAQIENLVEAMRVRQQSGGGWGYSYSSSGDTSMTQYCVLAAWTAHRSGMRVPGEMMGRACDWLLRTQTPQGSWGYQGNDPGVGKPRIPQNDVRLSLAVAGTGSIYICADLFGVSAVRRRMGSDMKAGLGVEEIPDAFRPVPRVGSISLKEVAGTGMANRMKRAMAEGDEYIQNAFQIAPKRYSFYYLYALERYHSFREIAARRVEREPEWFNLGFEQLAATQQADGSWKPSESDVNVVPSTAFATLFLLRSSLKSLQTLTQFGEGLLVGGRGLPKDLSSVRLQGGRVVGTRQSNAVTDIVAVLENPEHPQFDELELNAGSALVAGGEALRSADVERLRRLVRGGDYKVRRLAVKALGARRDFDDIPILIYALSDPDDQVSIAARDALRFVTRKFDGFGMPDQPNVADKRAAVAAWKNWYQAINPSAEFRNDG